MPHKEVDESRGVLLDNGTLKVGPYTYVIPPSGFGNGADLRAGSVVDNVEGFQSYNPNPSGKDAFDEYEETAPARKSRSQKKAKPAPAPARKPPVVLDITLPGIGTVPSQYAHCYVGEGVLVLGATRLSYKPKQVTQDQAGGLSGIIEIGGRPGRYVYFGQHFMDADGIDNLILARLPEAPVEDDDEEFEDEMEEPEDDGQEV